MVWTCLKLSCLPLLFANMAYLSALVAAWFEYAESLHAFPWDWDHPRAFTWECQQPPLKSWILGLCTLGMLFAALSCCWVACLFYQALPGTTTPRWAKRLKLPLLWTLVRVSYGVACIGWEVVGLYWVSVADEQCLRRQDRLLAAIEGFCWVNMASVIAVYIYLIMPADLGISPRPPSPSSVARAQRVERERPKATMEGSTRPVSASDASLGSATMCPICLDDLDDTLPIVVTRSCRHAFHEQCMCHWLRVQGYCPSCRQDLVLPEA